MTNLDEIELLSTDLLLDNESIKEVYRWIKMFNAEVGWHYSLDLLWQYNKIMSLNLPKGATIIDAGAGNGMMQFILAGNGCNIISIDFLNRKLPILQSNIFNMSNEKHQYIHNEYTEHLTINSRLYLGKILNKLKLSFTNLSWFYLINGYLCKRSYGSIKFVQADFSDLSFIPTDSIDAIVSTSAIEHNPNHESLKKGISEFNRVLKPNSAMFITTSATDKESIYDRPTKGFFYDENTLVYIFQLGAYQSNFSEYRDIYKQIYTNEFLKKNLPYNYRNNANCGMPFGIWNPRYIPVGITKWKI